MKKTLIAIVFLIYLTIIAYAQKHPSSIKAYGDSLSINQMVIVNNTNLQPFINDLQKAHSVLSYKSNTIPWFVKSFLESFGNTPFTIADPGEDWNCCCDRNEKLPDRQLIFLSQTKDLCLIYYLTGGIFEMEHLVLIKYKDETIIDFWTGTLQGRFKTRDAIIKYLIRNKNKKEVLHNSLNI